MGLLLSILIELLVRAVWSLVAPPRCAACDGPVRRRAVFCPACAASVVPAEAAAAGRARPLRVSALVYGGAAARAIGKMKYEGRPDLARPLGDLLWRAIEPHAGALRDVVVVPVPLHATRLVERGFNQAALLGGLMARRLAVPFAPRALARTRETGQQAALDRAARVANVAGAFAVRGCAREGLRRWGLRGREVLLVDDVTTTGATFDACEVALMKAGAAAVHRAALASAPHRVEGTPQWRRGRPHPGP